MFEHIHEESRLDVLGKIHSLLNDDGILLFSGPNCFSLLYGAGYVKERIMNFLSGNDGMNWHYHIPYQVHIKNLEESGFFIQEWKTDGTLPVLFNAIKKIFGRATGKIVSGDRFISKILRGMGANFYCIAQKRGN